MTNEYNEEEAGTEEAPAEDIQSPAEAVDFQDLELDQDALNEQTSVSCNVAAL